jgi:glycosyltransferase involved in cell wall biosynthesis
MKALEHGGNEVGLVTVVAPPPEAIEGLSLRFCRTFEGVETNGVSSPLRGLPERFRSYWGIPPDRIQAVADWAREFRADAVVVVGLDVLPYLGAVEGCRRIWYAGDEWIWHHLSQVRLSDRTTLGNLREAAVKGLYEYAYGPYMDRVWVVSEADGRAMRRVVGRDKVVIVPNGVDSEYYSPREVREIANSCVFWGRLDFGPNVQAVEWFCRRVWPRLKREVPDATFTIYGFNPTPRLKSLAEGPGIDVIADLPDLRDEIARHAVVVLPFVSGGGIKNKLLEAAGLARPVVASSKAMNGVREANASPLVCASSASAWVRSILDLWNDPTRRLRLGKEARDWVIRNHSWTSAAQQAMGGLKG